MTGGVLHPPPQTRVTDLRAVGMPSGDAGATHRIAFSRAATVRPQGRKFPSISKSILRKGGRGIGASFNLVKPSDA